jgi:hypothetical protein
VQGTQEVGGTTLSDEQATIAVTPPAAETQPKKENETTQVATAARRRPIQVRCECKD